MWGFSVYLHRSLIGSDSGCDTSPSQNCHSFLRPAVSHPASPCQHISLKISQSVLGKRLASHSMFPHSWNAKLGSKWRWSTKSYSPLSALAQIDSVSIPDCWRRSLKKEKRWKNEEFIISAIWTLLRMSPTVFQLHYPSVFTASVHKLFVTCATSFMTHSPAVI